MLNDVLYYFNNLEKKVFDFEFFNQLQFSDHINFDFNNQLNFDDTLFFTRWILSNRSGQIGFDFLNKESEAMDLKLADDIDIKDLISDYRYFSKGMISMPFHRNSHIEICYVYKGELTLKIEDHMVVLPEKSAMMMDKRLLHSECIKPNNGENIILFLGVNDALVRTFMYPLKAHSKSFIRRALLNEGDFGSYFIVDLKQEARQFEYSLLSALKELQNKQPGYKNIVLGYYARMYDYLLGRHDQVNIHERSEAKQHLLHDVLRYIEFNLVAVTLDDLSNEFQFSKDYFNRLIKNMTGSTFSDYLKEIRLNKAMQLLAETDIDVDKIALEVGYNNKSFFYSLFREKLNMTPSEYRKQTKL